MSWDISLTEEKVVTVDVAEVGNYTCNVSPMYVEAMGHTLSDLDGETAEDWIETLKAGVAAMEADPKKYLAMEPDNGWGHYQGALDYLRKFRDSCIDHPHARIEVD